jgi:hypothetical protein
LRGQETEFFITSLVKTNDLVKNSVSPLFIEKILWTDDRKNEESMNSQGLLAEASHATSSWATIPASYTAVPAAFQRESQHLLATVAPFPYVVFAPAVSGLRRKTGEHLLCDLDDKLYVFERAGGQMAMAVYPLANVCLVEVGHILLYSWLTISGVNAQGQTTSSTIPFNTVSTSAFMPFVNRLRPFAAVKKDEDEEKKKFNYLETLSYKFMNYARASLAPGEKVIQTIWQPKIRTPLLTLFGRSLYRTRSLAHLVILTDKELIFIGDDKRLAETRGERYGGVWQYVPLRWVTSVSLTEQEGGLLTVSIHLACGGWSLDKLLGPANASAAAQFQTALAQLIGSA